MKLSILLVHHTQSTHIALPSVPFFVRARENSMDNSLSKKGISKSDIDAYFLRAPLELGIEKKFPVPNSTM